MATRDELNERALLAASLHRQKMTRAQIASHLGINERQVSRLLTRASRYYRDLVRNFDQELFLGESLIILLEMEREALKNLEAVDAGDLIAVEWLEAALDIRREITELMQIIVSGRTKSEKSEVPTDVKKSRRDRSRSKLRKLDKGKDRNLHCIRPEAPDADAPESK